MLDGYIYIRTFIHNAQNMAIKYMAYHIICVKNNCKNQNRYTRGEGKKRRVQTSSIHLCKQHRLYWNLNKELEIAFSCVVSEFRCSVGWSVGQKTLRTRLSTKVVWNAVISYNLISLCEILLIQFASFSFREKLFNTTTTTKTSNFVGIKFSYKLMEMILYTKSICQLIGKSKNNNSLTCWTMETKIGVS